MHLDAQCLGASAYLIANRTIRRNRADESADTVSGEEICDEADSADVLVTVLAAEPESPGNMLAHDITVQHFDPDPARQKVRAHPIGDGAFPRTAQAGEPHDGAAAGLARRAERQRLGKACQSHHCQLLFRQVSKGIIRIQPWLSSPERFRSLSSTSMRTM